MIFSQAGDSGSVSVPPLTTNNEDKLEQHEDGPAPTTSRRWFWDGGWPPYKEKMVTTIKNLKMARRIN